MTTTNFVKDINTEENLKFFESVTSKFAFNIFSESLSEYISNIPKEQVQELNKTFIPSIYSAFSYRMSDKFFTIMEIYGSLKKDSDNIFENLTSILFLNVISKYISRNSPDDLTDPKDPKHQLLTNFLLILAIKSIHRFIEIREKISFPEEKYKNTKIKQYDSFYSYLTFDAFVKSYSYYVFSILDNLEDDYTSLNYNDQKHLDIIEKYINFCFELGKDYLDYMEPVGEFVYPGSILENIFVFGFSEAVLRYIQDTPADQLKTEAIGLNSISISQSNVINALENNL